MNTFQRIPRATLRFTPFATSRRVRRHVLLALPSAMLIWATACAPATRPFGRLPAPTALESAPNELQYVREELFFGMSRAGGRISDGEWQTFLTTIVTPRFPTGLTVLQARGQYQMANGTIVEEESRVLVLLYRRDEPTAVERERAIEDIIAEYKGQFSQESVLRVQTRVAVSL